MQHKLRVFLVCAFGIFVTVFDTSAAIVALPTIAAEFATDLPTAQWVILGNSLTIAALLVPLGRLSDSIGRKRSYVIGALVFACGAAVAANAPGIYALIGARVLVGVGSAMTQSTATAILVGSFSVQERARVLGWQMAAVGLGAIAGPATGGLIVGTVGWRTLFALTAIAMAVTTIAGHWTLKRPSARARAEALPFDITGAALFSALLAALLLVLTLGPRLGFRAPAVVVGYIVCTALLAAFVVVERRSRAPLLDLASFRHSAFALGALGAVVAFMGVSSTRFLAPFFLQAVKGFDASRVGLAMLPAAAVTAIVGPFVGRLAGRFGVRLLANLGLAISMLGLATFWTLDVESPVWLVVVGLMTIALGLSTFSTPNSTSMLNAVDPRAYGFAAGFVNLCRNTGNVFGIALGTAFVTLTMADAGHVPSLDQVRPDADLGLLAAFTAGLRRSAAVLLMISAAVLAVLVGWAWRRRSSPPQ